MHCTLDMVSERYLYSFGERTFILGSKVVRMMRKANQNVGQHRKLKLFTVGCHGSRYALAVIDANGKGLTAWKCIPVFVCCFSHYGRSISTF